MGEIDDLIKSEIPTKEELGIDQDQEEKEQKVVEIVESCKVYRGTFILKKELIRKLEEAFPEKWNNSLEKNYNWIKKIKNN